MLRPAISQILSKNESHYSFVVAVAKRAREIVDISIEHKTQVDEKPVKTAVEEFANGHYKLVEDPSLNHKAQ